MLYLAISTFVLRGAEEADPADVVVAWEAARE